MGKIKSSINDIDTYVGTRDSLLISLYAFINYELLRMCFVQTACINKKCPKRFYKEKRKGELRQI